MVNETENLPLGGFFIDWQTATRLLMHKPEHILHVRWKEEKNIIAGTCNRTTRVQRGFWSFGLITHCQSKDLRGLSDHICTDPYPTLGTSWHDNILGSCHL